MARTAYSVNVMTGRRRQTTLIVSIDALDRPAERPSYGRCEVRDDGRVRAHGGPRWNHNIHFHRVVLQAIPRRAVSALDVGTGDGLLAAELRTALADVTAVDLDPDVLARAAAEHRGISWVHGVVMTLEFDHTFDVVASIATVHHLRAWPTR